MLKHTHDFLRYVFAPGDIIELRAMSRSGKIISGRFRDFERAAKVAHVVDQQPGVAAIYYLLNPLSPKSKLTITERMEKGRAAGDVDVDRRKMYLIDFDPHRPSGVCSTEDEKRYAYDTALRVRDFLRSEGWPEPIVADSGNGYHLYYRGDGCDPESPYWHAVLQYLDKTFHGHHVHIDTSVANPARVSRLPGTTNRKGESTSDRPHRTSMVVEYPDKWERLDHSKAYRLARTHGYCLDEQTPSEIGSTGTRELLPNAEVRIHAFAVEIGRRVSNTFDRGGTRFFALDACPFTGYRHSGDPNKSAITLTDDTVGFRCLSDDCAGKGMMDLRKVHKERTGTWPKASFYRVTLSEEEPFDRELEDYYRRMSHTVQFRADVAADLTYWEAGIWPPPPSPEDRVLSVEEMIAMAEADEVQGHPA